MRNLVPAIQIETPATLKLEPAGKSIRLVLGGDWVVSEASRLDTELHALQLGDAREAEIDGSSVALLDSAGVWLVAPGNSGA
jgi:ABC-type transporter Mla MlaB component